MMRRRASPAATTAPRFCCSPSCSRAPRPPARAARRVLPPETRVRVEIVNPTAASLEAYRKDFTRGPQSVVTEAAIALPARATRVIDASVGDQVSVLDVPAAGAVRV